MRHDYVNDNINQVIADNKKWQEEEMANIEKRRKERLAKYGLTEEYVKETNVMNELDLIKLNIYESYDNGEITYGEKEYLLEQVDYMYEAGKSHMQQAVDNAAQGVTDSMYAAGAGLGAGIGMGAAEMGYNAVKKGGEAVSNFVHKHPKTTAGLAITGTGALAYGLYKNHKYQKSIPGVINKIKKLEQELALTIDPIEIKQIKKELAYYKKLLKELQRQVVKESTFDYLLESINDLYDDEY